MRDCLTGDNMMKKNGPRSGVMKDGLKSGVIEDGPRSGVTVMKDGLNM